MPLQLRVYLYMIALIAATGSTNFLPCLQSSSRKRVIAV